MRGLQLCLLVVLGTLWVMGCSRPPAPAAQPEPTPAPPVAAAEGSAAENRIPTRAELLAANEGGTGFVPWSEILSGGPPPDGIPAIDQPRFAPVGEIDWLSDREPVAAVEHAGEARAYPLQILIWHEIVNDLVGSEPVAVTYCPLCNSAITFKRTVNGRVLSFGTSGMLYHSDLVMYDRQTWSLWAQMEGRAIRGQLSGTKLEWMTTQLVSWADFKRTYPGGKVLLRETGHDRSYGRNPYAGYDTSSPFLFSGRTDPRLPVMERVVGINAGGQPRAWAYSLLARQHVVQADDVVLFYRPGAASAVDDATIADGRDVGSTGAFLPVLGGRSLHFQFVSGQMTDAETHSTWDIFGNATTGPLAGQTLTPVPKVDAFWFAWAAFYPHTELHK